MHFKYNDFSCTQDKSSIMSIMYLPDIVMYFLFGRIKQELHLVFVSFLSTFLIMGMLVLLKLCGAPEI